MRAFCSLLSGGKDSTYALHKALDEGLAPSCIGIVVPGRPDSWMFHRPFVEFVPLQLNAMGLSGLSYEIRVSGEKEKEVEELKESLARAKEVRAFDTLVIGGIASRYQLTRFGMVAEELGLRVYDPQWGMDPEAYMYELLRYGIIYVITQITTAGLPHRLLGVPVNSEGLVREIVELARKHGFHPAFEGGEAETFVIKAPRYSGGICLEARRVRVSEFEYKLEPISATLCDRPRVTIDGVMYEA
ncbi:MAG: putative ATPases of PP-loop superfamily [uncultured Acidilobus sp. JCHS]|nr:MAG: putative ATPases of PP-loop superfamily [uncultured Acidilobus sp. JCHS]